MTSKNPDPKPLTHFTDKAMDEIDSFANRYGWYIGIAALLLGGTAILYVVLHTGR